MHRDSSKAVADAKQAGEAALAAERRKREDETSEVIVHSEL